jgi:CheY-like chemotaxis protein
MLEIFQDITERKEFEVELIQAKDKAEEGDRLKTAFLHNISHEIRTPMNAIVGFSALLGEPDLDTQSRKDYIEMIMQSSNHLLSILSDIIDISNIEAGIVKIAKNKIDVNNTLRTILNQFTLKAKEKNVNLVLETELKDTDSLITADSTKLTQIITNLVSNALKFTDKGSVAIGCEIRDKFLEFRVSDTGIGISEEHHKRIFDRFYQVQHSKTRLYEGTGLGLAISRANAEHMGGRMWLTSEQGKGTIFCFTIPYEKQVVETPAIKANQDTGEFVFSGKKRILVAEDIDSNFKLISYFLSGANIEILRAENGEEAVEKCLSTKDIDLILMDVKMPVMDGYTAVKLIRETNTSIPIIVQTAYADDKQMAIDMGCSGFISKPFDKKSLIKKICEFI